MTTQRKSVATRKSIVCLSATSPFTKPSRRRSALGEGIDGWSEHHRRNSRALAVQKSKSFDAALLRDSSATNSSICSIDRCDSSSRSRFPRRVASSSSSRSSEIITNQIRRKARRQASAPANKRNLRLGSSLPTGGDGIFRR